DDALRAHGRDRLPGYDHADEVQRVGRVHDHALAASLHLPDPGQLVGGVRQRVLLAAEARDEAAAAHEPAVLEAPEGPLEVAPRDAQRVPGGEVAEHDPPAVEELLGDGLGQLVAIDVVAVRGHDRPPAGRRAACPGSAPQPGHAASVGCAADAADAGADGAEAVAHHEPARHAVPEPALHVVGQTAGGGDEVGGEAGAAVAQRLHDLGRGAHRRLGELGAEAGGIEEPG